ncbi:hypothetical protein CC79DRAFT_1367230 [Sarocladium strictum]
MPAIPSSFCARRSHSTVFTTLPLNVLNILQDLRGSSSRTYKTNYCCYFAQGANRNACHQIAAQRVRYRQSLNWFIGELPGGGHHFLEPKGSSSFCRHDKFDLLGYPEKEGLEDEERCHPPEERGH